MDISLNIVNKSISNLYKKLHCTNENLLFNKSKEKACIILNSHDVSMSFSFHNHLIDDTYLAYIILELYTGNSLLMSYYVK